MRRATPSIVAVAGMKRRQIHLGDRVEHEPRQVPLRQPLTQARRQQQLLLAITRDEVLRHHRIVLNPPDATRFVRHPPREARVERRDKRSCVCLRAVRRIFAASNGLTSLVALKALRGGPLPEGPWRLAAAGRPRPRRQWSYTSRLARLITPATSGNALAERVAAVVVGGVLVLEVREARSRAATLEVALGGRRVAPERAELDRRIAADSDVAQERDVAPVGDPQIARGVREDARERPARVEVAYVPPAVAAVGGELGARGRRAVPGRGDLDRVERVVGERAADHVGSRSG